MSNTLIALDYDGCASVNPEAWNRIIDYWRHFNMIPFIVTMRFKDEQITGMNAPVIYTGRKAKKPFVEGTLKLHFDIWIDDNPHFILIDSYEDDPLHMKNGKAINIFNRPEYDERRTTLDEIEFMMSFSTT